MTEQLRAALARAIEGGYADDSIDQDLYQRDAVYHAVVWEARKARAALAASATDEHDWRDHSSHPHHHKPGDPEPTWDRSTALRDVALNHPDADLRDQAAAALAASATDEPDHVPEIEYDLWEPETAHIICKADGCSATEYDWAEVHARPAVPETLDEAWTDAEAALPDGWVIRGLVRGSPASDDEYVAGAGALPFWQNSTEVRGYGPSPAEALRALAAALSAPLTEGVEP